MESILPINLGFIPAIPFPNSNIAIPVSILLVFSLLFKHLRSRFSNQTTQLNGPPNPNFLFGLNKYMHERRDRGAVYEEWASKYGPAFCVPGSLGSSRIIICDPKANAHLLAKQTVGYIQTGIARVFFEIQGVVYSGRKVKAIGGNFSQLYISCSEIGSNMTPRQRRTLLPAFSNTTVRKLTPIFYDIAYKMKSMWDSPLDAGHGQAEIDVHIWMSRISLDSIGIAGFGHDFRALEGHRSPVSEVLEAFGSGDLSLSSKIIFLLALAWPTLLRLPSKMNRMLKRLNVTIKLIATDMLAKSRKEIEAGSLAEEKSIIALLGKAQTTGSSLAISHEEVFAQNVLLLAGYETTSISLTWALIELARNPKEQQKLRDELSQFTGSDPTFDQLSGKDLPYLESITQEVLRLHPPIAEISRIAAEDDIMPFSQPVTTASGETVSSIVIKKGTAVISPIEYMNRAEAFWGPNAKEFVPERWSGDDPCPGAREIHGHKHILTFSDGPRICLGKTFALAEFKAVLSVLIRNYTFDLPSGPSTVIETHPSLVPRPKVAGQIGAKVPMIIRRVE